MVKMHKIILGMICILVWLIFMYVEIKQEIHDYEARIIKQSPQYQSN